MTGRSARWGVLPLDAIVHVRLWSLYMFSRRATAAYWSGCLTMLYRVVQSFGLRCALLSNKSKPSSVIKRQTYFPNVLFATFQVCESKRTRTALLNNQD